MANSNTSNNKKKQAPKSGKTKQTAAKKPTSSKAAKAAEQNAAQRAAAKRQVISSVLLALALFLLFVTIVPSGASEGKTNLWQAIKDVFFGVFGVCAFTVPFMMFYTSYALAKDKQLNNLTLRLVGLGTAAISLSSALHTASHNSDYLNFSSLGEQIVEAWETGLKFNNGGVAGAFFGGILAKLFGKTGGLITLIILILVLVMLLTGTTITRLVELLSKPFSRATDYTVEKLDKIKQERELEEIVEEKPSKPSKKNAPYKKPESEKVLKGSKLPKGFFNEDYDPVPDKNEENENEPTPIETDEGDNIDIPVFSPIPANIDIVCDEPESKEALAQDDSAASFAEPELTPAQDVVDLIDKASREVEEHPPQQETLPMNEEDDDDSASQRRNYVLPDVECLAEGQSFGDADIKEELTANANKLVETLRSFNIETKIVDIVRGPSVTRYEIQPAAGIKISRISGLADDIAMNLATTGVRIEAPIPNKAAVGIEVPNRKRLTVTLREIIDSPQFKNAQSKLNVALGKDISGNVICTDIAKMPHLLIAGTTGSGKSVCLNAMIVSILFNSTPDEVKLVMIDPKQVEFTIYNGIPHLIVPVVSDPRKAAGALQWAVAEMLKRYKLFSEKGVRDIKGYNKLAEKTEGMEKMYQICIFIDELSDLMMVAQNEVEDSICRLAQMARAAGMHLIIATQRPSVNVITGIIKANIPSRIALFVSSQVDSRTIIDVSGAEKLLGNGDMLFNPVGLSKPVRLQGCYVSDEEVEKVVDFIKTQEECAYDDSVMEEIEKQAVLEKKKGNSLPDPNSRPDSGADEETMRAIAVVVENQLASTTLLQRKLKIGYAKAARIMDELEEKGIIGPFEGSKPRKVLMSKQQFNEMRALDDSAFVGSEGSEE